MSRSIVVTCVRSGAARAACLLTLLASASCYTSHVRTAAELRDVSGVEARAWLKDGSTVVLRDIAIRDDSLFGTTRGGAGRVGVALESVTRLEETIFDPLRAVLVAGAVAAVFAVALTAIAFSSIRD